MMPLLVVAAVVLVSGALCAALLVAPIGERRPGLVRGVAWAMWTAAGYLAAAAVVIAAVRLGSGVLARSETGGAFLVIIVGGLLVTTAVCLLGLFGLWASIPGRTRRRGSVR